MNDRITYLKDPALEVEYHHGISQPGNNVNEMVSFHQSGIERLKLICIHENKNYFQHPE